MKLVGETKYVDGIMYTYRLETKISTPIRSDDTCIENVFKFLPYDKIIGMNKEILDYCKLHGLAFYLNEFGEYTVKLPNGRYLRRKGGDKEFMKDLRYTIEGILPDKV